MHQNRFSLCAVLVCSILLLAGCPPQRFPFEDRWEQMTTGNASETQFDEAIKSLDTKLAEAALGSLTEAPATPREIVFRMNGTFAETVTLGGEASGVEGKWKVASAKSGREFQLELGKDSEVLKSAVTVQMVNDQIMLMRQQRDGKEAVTLWKRKK